MKAKSQTAGRAQSRKRQPARPSDAGLTVTLPQILNEGSDLQFREFVAVLFAVVTGMHSLRRSLAKAARLSAAEFSVLLAVWHLERRGNVGIVTIAKHLHVAAAHVTAEVGQLTDKGLLAKTPNPGDTRAVLIQLTKPGKKTLSQLAPLLRDVNDRLFSGYDEKHFIMLCQFVERLADESAFAIRLANSFATENM
jgi:DNA-binding MarR family transcriptional regulator